jgi:Flp pilus assembly pilin Flp
MNLEVPIKRSTDKKDRGVNMQHIKKIRSNIVNAAKKFWADESAQGMTEYVLLLVVIIALAGIFKDKIKAAVDTKMGTVSNDIQGFDGR